MKLFEVFRKSVLSSDQASHAEPTAEAMPQPTERALTENELPSYLLSYIIGQLGHIVLEKDSNANNPLSIRDVLGFSKTSTNVNFLVEFNGYSIGIVDGHEVRGCSDKATQKWLENLEYKEQISQ